MECISKVSDSSKRRKFKEGYIVRNSSGFSVMIDKFLRAGMVRVMLADDKGGFHGGTEEVSLSTLSLWFHRG